MKLNTEKTNITHHLNLVTWYPKFVFHCYKPS